MDRQTLTSEKQTSTNLEVNKDESRAPQSEEHARYRRRDADVMNNS